MSLVNSIRAQIPPVHPEGYPFIGGFALVSLILFWIWTPLGWLGTLMTVWGGLVFPHPVRVMPGGGGGAGGRGDAGGDAGVAAGRPGVWQQAAAAGLDLHERVQLPREPQSG